MKKFINQILAVILSITCTTLPVFAVDEADPEGTIPAETETNGIEENVGAEKEDTASDDEGSFEEQSAEETETSEEATLSEESEGPAETTVSEETEESEGTGTSETEEETTVSEEEKTESEEVSVITLDPVSYNGLTISVSYDSDAFGGKKVEMKTGDPGEVESAALAGLGQYKAVDITFVDEEGNPVQPEEGKSVSVVLKADEMENADNAIVAHVEGDGKISFLEDADINASNPVTKPVKTGETTTTVTVPEETEQVLVNDYKDESYYDFEVQEKVVEVPAVIGYRYVLKNKVVKSAGSNTKLGKNTSRSTARAQYYLEEEPYVIREGYTKVVRVRVPVLKTRKVLVGSHYETKVVNEAYTYEKTEDVYEDVEYSDVEAAFTADSFSVYALVVVDEDGGIDFDETFGINHITVKAPAGAFEKGTVMKIEGQDDPEVLKNALKVLDDNTYRFNAVDISFWKDGKEVEPRLPVEVTWTSTDIDAGDKLVHIKDDGTAELMANAIVKDDKVTFAAKGFSTYITTRIDTIDLNSDPADTAIVFSPSSIERPASMPSGRISETHPEIDGYTFKGAYIVQGENVDETDPVTYVGAFIYKELDEDGNPDESSAVTRIYYRTENTEGNSDLIIQLANDTTIQLTYNTTPYTVTYKVVYEGVTYTIGEDELPPELAEELVVSGPDSVAEGTTYDQAVSVALPRGYSATVQMSNQSGTLSPQLGAATEPTYTCSDGWNVYPEDYPFTIDGKYTISNVTSDLTVTINVTKRTSYRFSASLFENLAQFGQGSRYQDVNPRLSYDFTGNSTTFSFTTLNTGRIVWAMDALNINKQTLVIPFVGSEATTASETTTLESGTVVTINAEYLSSGNRRYTISVSNCYENITITGGNLHNVNDKPEWAVQQTENIAILEHGKSPNYEALQIGYVMTYPGWETIQNNNNRFNIFRNQSYWVTRNSIRFKVADGYVNPQIKYVTAEGADDYSRVLDISLAAADTDYYHLVTSAPNPDGYYYLSLRGNSSDTYMGLLSIRAELARYGVSYDKGDDVSDADMPGFDDGGHYGGGTLRGYNVKDNETVIVAKSAPVDPTNQYIFLHYTIDGDESGDTYAPSQKIPLTKISEFGEYDSTKGQYVIKFVAHWEKKEQVKMVNVEAKIYLDDVLTKTVNTSVPKGKSIYIDIDSDTMNDFMTEYDWQLFYDEVGSDPFVDDIQEDKVVELRVYSKFYIYHSATGILELHTTKEMEKGTGDDRYIDKLNLAQYVDPDSLYGGYYSDYLGAHEGNTASGKNLVNEKMVYENDEDTLTTAEINALSDKNFVVLNDKDGTDYVKLGTKYVVNDQAGFWSSDAAYTVNATGMKPERAKIYYLKEVPTYFMRNYHQVTYNKSSLALNALYLVSAIDDTNYTEYGYVMTRGPEQAEMVSYLSFTNTATNKTVKLEPNIVFNAKGITGKDYDGYLTYIDATGTEYFNTGEFTVLPYWKTPDGIEERGRSTRTITITEMKRTGISKTDGSDVRYEIH